MYKGKYKEDILKLRNQGKSYNEICKILGCSKSTVSYYCDPKGSNKVKERKKRIDPRIIRIQKQWYCFKTRKVSNEVINEDWEPSDRKLYFSWYRFVNRIKKTDMHDYEKVLEHIGGWQTKCYLTGRPIDLTKDDYNFDHIQPVSKGGSCELENLGLTCPDANASKTNLTLDEYLQLCKEVLENFGYKVEKLK